MKSWRTRWGLSLLALLAVPAQAGDWANWRGPAFNGSSEEKKLPVRFSTTENVLWSTPLPGPAPATPIIYRDKVFVSSTDTQKMTLLAMCLDRKTGKVIWSDNVGSGYRPGGRGNAVSLDQRSLYASPSPVTDGKRVFFFYGNGDLAGYTLDGKRLWYRNIQKDYGDFAFQFGFSSTPQLWEGKLYFQLLQRDQPTSGRGAQGAKSLLFAFDPATGKELWSVERPTAARLETREAYTTPIPFVHNGRKELLIAGGDLLTGHDPATGKELWRWGLLNTVPYRPDFRLVPSPVAGGGVVLGCAPKREPVYAVKLGASGDVTRGGLAWKSEERSVVTSDVPTPLFYRNRFYILSDVRKALSCVDPGTGKTLWSTSLEGPSACWASPTGADGKIYLLKLNGEAMVLDAESGQVLHTTPMAEDEDEIRSTIAVASGCLFIRTNSRLYCIGLKK